MNQQVTQSKLAFSIRSGVLASLVWGGWAFHINESRLATSGLAAGLTQGCSSFLMTLVMVKVIAYVSKHIPTDGFGLLIPAIVTVSASTCFLTVAHLLAQTPNVLATILPATGVAFVFCLATTLRFRREKLHKPIRQYHWINNDSDRK